MGQKCNPNSLRYGVYRNYNSIWYSKYDYAKNLILDFKIRKAINKKYEKNCGILQIVIKKTTSIMEVDIYTAKVGVILGNSGKIYKQIVELVKKIISNDLNLNVKIIAQNKLFVNSKWIANNICQKLENRESFKRVQKNALRNAIKNGCKGIKITISGRLNGVAIARSETLKMGKLPLNTFRAKIYYAFSIAKTTYGILGVKVWVYHGNNIQKPKLLEVNG